MAKRKKKSTYSASKWAKIRSSFKKFTAEEFAELTDDAKMIYAIDYSSVMGCLPAVVGRWLIQEALEANEYTI